MPYSKETLVMFFFNLSTSFHLLFIFFYLSSILLAKFFRSLCRKTTSQRSTEESEVSLSEDEDLGFFSFECTEKEDLVADIINGGEALLFLPVKKPQKDQILAVNENLSLEEPEFQDPDDIFVEKELSSCKSLSSESIPISEDVLEENLPSRDIEILTSPISISPNGNVPVTIDEAYEDFEDSGNLETNFSEDEKFLTFAPVELESEKLQGPQESVAEEVYGDSYTTGSTSKSSSEWRSSINYRDSVTEDPFSSSSRRSCPTWESFAVFRKYDEEMTFLDQISAQKLNERESFKAVKGCPRSMSQRIVHKLTTKNKKYKEILRNPLLELEVAYVAQICLAWEALNWNYKNYQRLVDSRRDEVLTCSGQIAQQFQQFQVLLLRFIENEPYEHGRRPEVFARIRISAPKLLQVPEYRESEDDQKEEEGLNTRVSSAKLLMIMEDAIQIFMNFLKADKEKNFQIITAFFKKNHKSNVDPNLLHQLKKENKKKKVKVKDLRRTRKCLKKRRLKQEEEMEILTALIDLKVVSRVLRMSQISEEQLHWCEEKMRKVKVWEGKLQRDSSPLFFPAH